MYNFPDERLGQFSDPVFYLMINGDLKSDNIDALFTGGGSGLTSLLSHSLLRPPPWS